MGKRAEMQSVQSETPLVWWHRSGSDNHNHGNLPKEWWIQAPVQNHQSKGLVLRRADSVISGFETSEADSQKSMKAVESKLCSWSAHVKTHSFWVLGASLVAQLL